jgi:hypothetical protein
MMKSFFYKLLIIVLPVGALVISVNYFVDPANLFSSGKYGAGIVDILAKGHNVDNISNYDERLLQEQMIEKQEKAPGILVLGSSRIMEIGSDFFPGTTVLNCGVSHANIHDLVAITGLFSDKKCLPKEIFLNVDPGLVGKRGTLEWQTLYRYYSEFCPEIGWNDDKGTGDPSQSNSLRKAYNLVSFEYFKQSLTFLLKGSGKRYFDIGSRTPVKGGRFSDGTICYPYIYTHPDTIKLADDARITAERDGIPEPDSDNLKIFNKLLDFFDREHIKVTFVMIPYHREYYSTVNTRQNGIFFTYDRYFRSLAKQRGIKVIGGFDPNAFGIRDSQVYDPYHCSKSAIKQIFSTAS